MSFFKNTLIQVKVCIIADNDAAGNGAIVQRNDDEGNLLQKQTFILAFKM